MIGLDTNVLVRYVTQDDPEQSPLATRLIESLDATNQGFVSLAVLVELHWVLRRAYRVNRTDAAAVVRKLLIAEELVLQEPEAVHRALTWLGDDIDFPDALISELGALADCSHTVTFDAKAADLSGMKLLSADSAG